MPRMAFISEKQSLNPIVVRNISFILALLVALFCLPLIFQLVIVVESYKALPSSEISLVDAFSPALGAYAIGATIVICWYRTFSALIIYSLAFGMRILLGYLLGGIFTYDDERNLHGLAKEIASAWRHGNIQPHSEPYPNIVAVLYFVFRPNILLPKTMNALIGSLLPFFVYDLAHLIGNNKRVARIILYFTAFAPPLVVYSGVNLKEVMTAALMILPFWSYLRIKPRFIGFVGCLAALVILVKFRAVYGGLAIIGVLFLILAGKRVNRQSRNTNRRLLVGVGVSAGVGLMLLLLPSPIQSFIFWRINSAYAAEKFQFVANHATIGQFLATDQGLSPQNLIILTLRPLISPHPFRFVVDQSFATLIESTVMTIWYILLPLACIGAWHNRLNGYVLTWALVTLVGVITVGLASYLGGDPYRHRIALFPFLYLLSGLGIPQVKQYRRVLWVWVLVVTAFTGLYFRLRI